MADMPYFTFQQQQAVEPEVKVYEYIVPNSSVRPPRTAYPGAAPLIPMMPMRAPSPAAADVYPLAQSPLRRAVVRRREALPPAWRVCHCTAEIMDAPLHVST